MVASQIPVEVVHDRRGIVSEMWRQPVETCGIHFKGL